MKPLEPENVTPPLGGDTVMPSLGPDAFTCITDHAGHCITCSDEGVAMTVIALDPVSQLATCEDGDGTRCVIDVGLIDAVVPGTSLLTHAGTAIAALSGTGGERA